MLYMYDRPRQSRCGSEKKKPAERRTESPDRGGRFLRLRPGRRDPAGRKEKMMRRTIILLLCLLLSLSLCACAGREAAKEGDTTQNVRPQTSDMGTDTESTTESAPAPMTDVEETAAEPDATEIIPEGALTEEEQAAALLAQCEQAGATETEFTCSQSLYDDLTSDQFRQLRMLLIKSGASGRIRYRESDRYILLEDLTFPRTPWAECDTEAAVKQAMLHFGEDQEEHFMLLCPEELANALQENSRLFNFAAQGGYQKISYYHNDGLIEVTEGVLFDEPYAVVEDAAQFAAAVEEFARRNLTSFYIVREQKYREQLREDKLSEQIMISGSMLEKYGGTISNSGVYHYTDVSYTTDPKMICYNEDDVTAAIRQMGAIGAAQFRLYLVGDLIEPLCEQNFQRLHKLEAEAGMSSARMAYSFSQTLREIQYSEAKIVADAVALGTTADAIAYVEEKVRSGETELTLFCSEKLYSELIGNLDNSFSIVHDGMTPIYDLLAQAGIYDYELTSSRASHAVTIRIKSLYPGAELVRAVNTGTEKQLSDRLQQTLKEARAIADSCKSADPLKTAAAIHDALCARTSYETVEEKSENDTAVGVLLNGKADCDGYADAFYLTGSLAGLHVRYQHGKGVNSGFYGFLDSTTHMWNLLELDGSWRMVDVTWDDSAEEPQYTWFNLGRDRASRSHRWNEEMTVKLLEATDLAARPENEYAVRKAAELETAVKQAFSQKQTTFSLIFDSETYVARQEALDLVKKQYSGSFSYSWNEEMRMLRLILQ